MARVIHTDADHYEAMAELDGLVEQRRLSERTGRLAPRIAYTLSARPPVASLRPSGERSKHGT